jgi:hypothetical protein
MPRSREAAMPIDQYCKIYVNAAQDETTFAQTLCRIVDGKRTIVRTVASAQLLIDIFCHHGPRTAIAEFLNWPYYLEIDSAGPLQDDEFVGAISRLLAGLRANGFGAVASCDFEELLPG